MKNKLKMIKKFLFVGALMIVALTVFGALPEAAAVTDFGEGNANPAETEGDFRTIVLIIVKYFLTFLGLLATCMVIYGGIQYVTSAGNDETVGKAKKVILYSVIGIIVILLAFAIVNLAIGSTTGA